ncbi:MAG: UTP--glucose-1-phosphate uridylyltransferase [Deltaproteobacteria bacterium]|nr:UTP--glucose-1-phosphate uridylyltransferase [Deltaproteobacteria bacterium]MBW2075774.1 UTP--glucose-1-phosphate uridylyltransferase [Deltaproteobacteria bacterium]
MDSTTVNEHNQLESKIAIQFQPFAEKMEKNGLRPMVIDTFRHYYALLVKGETGLITRADIDPVHEGEIADAEKLSGLTEAGRAALEKLVVIKLNGGLGTSMGLSGAKSLLEVKDGLTFLDIIARQILTYRRKRGVKLPLVLMNSFNTEADTQEALSSYRDLATEIPLTFLQHKFPKVVQDGLTPVNWPSNPELEWNPPGHGDIYTALVTSGMLQQLLGAGICYAFISNSDNLGAVVDETILGYFAKNNLPFMMEVADRTEADSKGGHLARLKNGRLTLREIAQCPEDEMAEFQDINIYKYFNTNTIWINLLALQALLDAHHNVIHLPMIRNPKTVDPRDDSTPPVYQVETAMGSAISIFDGASAIRVPRTRFAPVKKCQDLLALWSDCYVLTDDDFVIQNPRRKLGTLVLRLDPRYYKRIDQLKARFPHGAPSLLECASLDVEGDVLFGKGIVIKGKVVIANRTDHQVTIPDGSVIEKDLAFR